MQLSRCVSAIPEDDIVFLDVQDSQYLCCAGLAPAVRLHPADAGLILFLLLAVTEFLARSRLLSLSRSESTSGYEIRQDLISP